jgi:hypothetical protein
MLFAQMKHATALRILGFAAASLLTVWLPGERAFATCGDYVTTDGRAIAGHFMPDRLDGGQGVAPRESLVVPEMARRIPANRPCQGPNCSRRTVPLSVPPVTVPSHSHEWMLPAVVSCDFSVGRLGIIQIDSVSHLQSQAGIIFRPPRPI